MFDERKMISYKNDEGETSFAWTRPWLSYVLRFVSGVTGHVR